MAVTRRGTDFAHTPGVPDGTAEASATPARAAVIARSVAVGAVATALDLSVLALFVHGAALDPRIASPVALTAGVAAQFVGNKLVAFRDRSPRWLQQGIAFGVVEAVAFALNLAAFHAISSFTSLPVLAARLATTSSVYLAFCLPAWSRIFAAAPATRGELPR